MGWFDEDDDVDDDEEEEEEEEEEEQQHILVAHAEKEDPLDAYMKSLDTNTSTTLATWPPRAGRLDLENEEEATSHWEEPLRTKHGDEDEDESSAERKSAASREALANTFHRGGGKQQEQSLTLTPIHHDEMAYPDFEKSFWTATDTSRGHEWRHQHQVTCSPGTVDPIVSFQECRIVFGNGLCAKIEQKGFTSLTLVQSQTLPAALAGMDALVTASTGSGKTLAYVWPMVVHILHQVPLDQGETGPMAIVLVPTRELALQVHKHVMTMLSSDYTSLAITGGISNYHLLHDLRKGGGCHAVVATPGRLLDLLGKKKGLSLGRVTFCVLDEADKMLDMGFESQVTEILKNVRPDRQSLLLSATMGRKVERLARQWLNDPVRIAVGRTGESSEHVQQHVMVLPSYVAKKEWMVEMLPTLAQVGRTLIFVSTRAECEELAEIVRRRSPELRIETLHGEKHQSDRNAALRAFSSGDLSALIATDVAARGLDVANVSTVVNFDPAKNLDAHVHRIGRAGRLAKGEHKKGVAYTLLTHKNADFAHVLVNAFEREGRNVTDELRALARKSRQSGNVASRTKWNKSGLGFHDPSHADQKSASGGYHGPSTSQSVEPPAKRSRWAK